MRASSYNTTNQPAMFITVLTAMELISASRKTTMRVAEDAGAIIHIGRSVRIDREKFLNALKNG